VKSLKRVGFAALPALIAMALLCASSAMAESTALCISDENPCAIANQIGYIHVTSVGKAKLLTSLTTIECETLFSGVIPAKSTSPPLTINGNFIYTNCTSGLGSCTATEENGPSEIDVLKTAHETTKVTGEGLVHVKCGKSLDCSYNGTGLEGTGKGPLLSTQIGGEVILTEKITAKEFGSLLCPKESKLDITITPLRAAYITTVKEVEKESHETSLCSTDGSGCGLTHVHEVSVGNAKLLTSIGTTECAALFLGDAKGASLASPLLLEGTFSYSSCALGGSRCTATEENGPSEVKVLKEGHETAKVTGEGLVHLVCGTSIDCSYTGTGLVGTAAGSLQAGQKNGEVSLTGQPVAKEAGGFLCPKESKLDITTSPLTATYIST
jgi:hypothetical protein